MNEIWKPVPGYKGYMVSDLGRVKSLGIGGGSNSKERILKPSHNGKGYYQITLSENGIRRNHRVNRLVWEAFNGPIPQGMEINHINEDKSDNSLTNLNLMTHKDNCNWGTRNKRLGKMVAQYDDDDNCLCVYFTITGACEETGTYPSNIIISCNNPQRKTGGFRWRYYYENRRMG